MQIILTGAGCKARRNDISIDFGILGEGRSRAGESFSPRSWARPTAGEILRCEWLNAIKTRKNILEEGCFSLKGFWLTSRGDQCINNQSVFFHSIPKGHTEPYLAVDVPGVHHEGEVAVRSTRVE